MRRRSKVLYFTLVFVAACNPDCQPMKPEVKDPDPYPPLQPQCMVANCPAFAVCEGTPICNELTDSCAPGPLDCPVQEKCVAPDGTCAPCGPGTMDDDADGDLVEDIACGGTDCNDRDGAIFPGSGVTEVCEATSPNRFADEDCNPATFGELDADDDGHVFAECCNRERLSDGTFAARCGDDCDDSNAAVHGGVVETCNRVDDDCDRKIDEGIAASQTLYADCDNDGFGSSYWLGVTLCLNPGAPLLPPVGCESDCTAADAGTQRCWSVTNTDCNDEDSLLGARHCSPGAFRDCGGLCDGLSGSVRNPINRTVNRCEAATCDFGTECNWQTGLSIFTGEDVKPAAFTTCDMTNSCGCTGDAMNTDVCAEPGDAVIARLSIGLPQGRYLITADGTFSGGPLDFAIDVPGEVDTIEENGQTERLSIGGQFVVAEGCPTITATVTRSNTAVPVLVRQMVLLRLE